MIKKLISVSLLLMTAQFSIAAPPDNFNQARNMVRVIYEDRSRTLYCGCRIEWNQRTGTSGKIDHQSCGYNIRSPQSANAVSRANRVEVEHIVPISWIGSQFQCGNRSECRASSPAYNLAEADLHGLAPAIGEVNMDRSNYRFGMVRGVPPQYGQCDFAVNFTDRVAEPADHLKGKIARLHFYYADHYGLNMSRQQQQLMMAWHKQFPVSVWEKERDLRIKSFMGHSNPFVTGEKEWSIDFKPSLKGLSMLNAEKVNEVAKTHGSPYELSAPILGNSSSKIYHLPEGCPSYSRINLNNAVQFFSEDEAVKNGYRKAGNCR